MTGEGAVFVEPKAVAAIGRSLYRLRWWRLLSGTMDRLGHSAPGATMRYQHVAEGRAQIIADLIADQLGPIDSDPEPDEGQ